MLLYIVCQTLQVGGLDLVFVLDASGSIGLGNFVNMTEAITNIVSSLTISPTATRVAVVTFSDNAKLEFNLNDYTEEAALVEVIRNIQYPGQGTNTAAALGLLQQSVFNEILGIRPDNESTKIAIVITDGHSNDRFETIQQANLLHNASVFKIFAIGIGENVDVTELGIIAGDNDSVIQFENFDSNELQGLERQITIEACAGGYICTYYYT